MALVPCKECKTEISTSATTCPKCGAPVSKQPSGCLAVVLAVGALIIFLVFVAGNSAFNQKQATVTRSAATSTPSEPEYQLELVSFNCSENSAGAILEGRVKNIGNEKLDGVWVVASFYTKSDEHIGSNDSVIEFNPILPGQTSPFKVYGPRNPSYGKCAVDGFKKTFGGSIPTKRK